jgi:hypothetical protein
MPSEAAPAEQEDAWGEAQCLVEALGREAARYHDTDQRARWKAVRAEVQRLNGRMQNIMVDETGAAAARGEAFVRRSIPIVLDNAGDAIEVYAALREHCAKRWKPLRDRVDDNTDGVYVGFISGTQTVVVHVRWKDSMRHNLKRRRSEGHSCEAELQGIATDE